MTNTEYRTKVNWLSRAFYLDKKIKNLTEKIEFLKLTARGTCAPINPTGVGGDCSHSSLEKKVISYIDLEQQREKCLEDLAVVRSEITQAIYNVDNPTSFSVLVLHYLDYKNWDEISEILEFSTKNKYVYQVHRRAVSYVQIPKEAA